MARLPIFDPDGLQPLVLSGVERAALDRSVYGPPIGSPRPVPSTSDGSRTGPATAPDDPLTGDLGMADLAVLERYADPIALLIRLGSKRLTAMIESASHNHQGAERAEQWLAAARSAVELYAGYPAVAFTDLAAEVATEVRLLRAVQAELTEHAVAREEACRWVDPRELARSLPGGAEIIAQHWTVPPEVAPATAARRWGRPPRQPEVGSRDGATFPNNDPQRHAAATSTDEPLTPGPP